MIQGISYFNQYLFRRNFRKKRSIIYPELEVVTFRFNFNDKVIFTQNLKTNNENEKLYEPTNIETQDEKTNNTTKVYDGWYYLGSLSNRTDRVI